jgi:hypothetical protein
MVKYPQYRCTQWLDTSDEAMQREQGLIVYGVQTKREKGGKWMHVHYGGEPLFFGSLVDASATCDKLRKESHD